MRKRDYHKYLASREWAVKKQAVRERCGGVCERCTARPMDHVHHLTYERIGAERLEDLQGLCEQCHEFVSGVTQVDPALQPKPTNSSGKPGRMPVYIIAIWSEHAEKTAATMRVFIQEFEAWTAQVAPLFYAVATVIPVSELENRLMTRLNLQERGGDTYLITPYMKGLSGGWLPESFWKWLRGEITA